MKTFLEDIACLFCMDLTILQWTVFILAFLALVPIIMAMAIILMIEIAGTAMQSKRIMAQFRKIMAEQHEEGWFAKLLSWLGGGG